MIISNGFLHQGVLSTTEMLDSESRGIYSLVVQATDVANDTTCAIVSM